MFLYNSINNFSIINRDYLNLIINSNTPYNTEDNTNNNTPENTPEDTPEDNTSEDNISGENISGENGDNSTLRINNINTMLDNLIDSYTASYINIFPDINHSENNNQSNVGNISSENIRNLIGSIRNNTNRNTNIFNNRNQHYGFSIDNILINNNNNSYEEYSNLTDVEVGVSDIDKICKDFVLQEDFECVICREDFKSGDTVKKTTCGHMFCTSCTKTWFSANKKCPICNNEFN